MSINSKTAGSLAAPAAHADPELGERALARAARRLIPLLAALYFVSFLDRVNIGFAALTMNADLGLSASAFGLGAGIFFVGYTLFTVPANMMLQRLGASRWLALISIVWGVISAATAFVTTPIEFYAVRFILGVTEAGFLPGVILYLTYWFPKQMRGRIIGNFFVAVPLANVLGAPLSGWLLTQSAFGFRGWQVMFIVEALPAIVLGIITLFWLTDRPGSAKWLAEGERRAIETLVDDADQAAGHPAKLRDGLLNPIVWRLGILYFLIVIGLYGFGFWSPQILRSLGDLNTQQTGWIVAIPNLVAAIGLVLWSRRSDRAGERIWHVAIPVFLSGVGFLVAGEATSLTGATLAFAMATVGIYAACPIIWTLPPLVLRSSAAAAGIALVNSLGNVGGYAGPMIMGYLKESTGGYAVGLAVLAASMTFAGFLALSLRKALPQ